MPTDINEIERIKTTIENLPKIHHIAILKIIKKNPTIIINENKSGVYINLTFLPKDTYNEIKEYLSYIENQETMLEEAEKEKQIFKTQIQLIDDNTNRKEDKDNFPNIYSYIY